MHALVTLTIGPDGATVRTGLLGPAVGCWGGIVWPLAGRHRGPRFPAACKRVQAGLEHAGSSVE